MGTIRILLADDHPVVCQGIRALLENEDRFSVIAEANDGLATLRLGEKLTPDVVVVDIIMPKMNGLEVTRQVSRRFPKTRIVVLSMYANEAYVLEALQNGAASYVLKSSTAADLVKAILEALAGRRYLSPPLSDNAIEMYVKKSQAKPSDPYERLTTREREVLQLAAEGETSAEIADRLFTSRRTVEVHRSNLMRKLSLRNQSELIRYAISRGILKVEDSHRNLEPPSE